MINTDQQHAIDATVRPKGSFVTGILCHRVIV
jgi:hypothetical protein